MAKYSIPFAALFISLCALQPSLAGEPIIPGYLDYAGISAKVKELGQKEWAEQSTLCTTTGGRAVHLLTVGIGDAESKPAIAVVGSVVGSHLLGGELCLRMAEELLADATEGGAAMELLKRNTVYFIPWLNPDASAGFLDSPLWERTVNLTQTDEDGDFRIDEDGYDDLNGDGLITMMRVQDEAGTYRTHPKDSRVMIEAEEKDNETGSWKLFSEGIDNDGDEDFNEDGPGGVDLNRNFPYNYPHYGNAAGRYAASEDVTRAVVDFFYDHNNIAMVYSFSPEDNLMNAWKTKGGDPKGKFYSAVHKDDAAYFAYFSEQYKEIRKENGQDKGAPKSPNGAGSFTKWAYFHYGRWSLTARGWWLTKPEEKKEEKEAKQEVEANDSAKLADAEQPTASEEKPEAKPEEEPEEKLEDVGDRGKDDLAALAWMEEAGLDGFVDWQEVDHPDFPGQLVEVGGFKPYLRLNPPAGMLDGLGQQHYAYLLELGSLLPHLEISAAKVEDLGGGIYRVTVEVSNLGYLPTIPAMGEVTRSHQKLQLALELPPGAELLYGAQRVSLGALAGQGGIQEVTWRIRAKGGGELALRAWAPAVGEATATVNLDTGNFTQGVAK